MVEFTDLPNELLTRIAGLLDLQTYCNFSLVCQRTAEIARVVKNVQKEKSLSPKYKAKGSRFFNAEKYLSLPNGEIIQTPKMKFPVKTEPENFEDTDSRIKIETQLLSLVLHSNDPEDSQEQQQNRNFLLTYWRQLAPVELLWAVWNFMQDFFSLDGWPIRFANFIEYWVRKNFIFEWNGCVSSAEQMTTATEDYCNIFRSDLLYKEMKRINKVYHELCPEGAERIKITLKTLKEKLKCENKPGYQPKAFLSSQKSILEFSTEEIVRQLILLDYYDLSVATPNEFDLVRLGRYGLTSHIKKNIDRFNVFCKKICDSILQAETRELRALIISKIEEIALFAIEKAEVVDYNTCYIVISALNNSAIYRLKHSTAFLANISSNTAREQSEAIRELLISNASYRNYREHARNQVKPYIPILGVLLTDYTFIVEGQHSGIYPVIEKQKGRLIAQTYDSLHNPLISPNCVDAIKSLSERNRNWDFADWLYSPCSIYEDEEKVYYRSTSLEPKGSIGAELTCGSSENPLIHFPISNILLSSNEKEVQIMEILNPFTTPYESMLAKAKQFKESDLIPFLVANFHHLRTREITEEENNFPGFRLNVIISIQWRILLLLLKKQPKKKGQRELVNNLLHTIPPDSCFYSRCKLYLDKNQ